MSRGCAVVISVSEVELLALPRLSLLPPLAPMPKQAGRNEVFSAASARLPPLRFNLNSRWTVLLRSWFFAPSQCPHQAKGLCSCLPEPGP